MDFWFYKVRNTVMRKDDLCVSVSDLGVRASVSHLLGRRCQKTLAGEWESGLKKRRQPIKNALLMNCCSQVECHPAGEFPSVIDGWWFPEFSAFPACCSCGQIGLEVRENPQTKGGRCQQVGIGAMQM